MIGGDFQIVAIRLEEAVEKVLDRYTLLVFRKKVVEVGDEGVEDWDLVLDFSMGVYGDFGIET